MGTRDYYTWRNENAPDSFKKGEGPNYYTEYGLPFFDKFQGLREGASPKLDSTIGKIGLELQLGLERRLQANPAIELSRASLYNAAFDTHSVAYRAGGFFELGIADQARMVGTIGTSVFNPLTWREGYEAYRGR